MYDQTAMSNQLQKSLLQKQIITLVPSALYYPFAEQTGWSRMEHIFSFGHLLIIVQVQLINTKNVIMRRGLASCIYANFEKSDFN